MRVLSGFTSVGREGRALSVRAPADRGYRTRGTHHHPHAQALGRYSTTARHTQYTACIHRAHTCTVTGARRAPRLLWAARLARCAGCAGLRALGAAATRAKGPGRRQPQRARPPRRARRAAARRARPPRHAAGLPPPPREAAAARGRCRSRTSILSRERCSEQPGEEDEEGVPTVSRHFRNLLALGKYSAAISVSQFRPSASSGRKTDK